MLKDLYGYCRQLRSTMDEAGLGHLSLGPALPRCSPRRCARLPPELTPPTECSIAGGTEAEAAVDTGNTDDTDNTEWRVAEN